MVNVKTKDESDRLYKFLVKNNVTKTFAGITMDIDAFEAIFDDTGSNAANIVFGEVYDNYIGKNTDWGSILSNRLEGFISPYQYKVRLDGEEVWIEDSQIKGVYFAYYREAYNLGIVAIYESSIPRGENKYLLFIIREFQESTVCYV